MSAFTDVGETLYLNFLRGQDLPAATTIHLVAYTTVSADDGNTQSVEVTDTGYARQVVSFGDIEDGEGGIGRQCANDSLVEFGPFAVTGGQITAIGVALDGSVVWRDHCEPRNIVAGERIAFDIGKIVFKSSGKLSNAYRDKIIQSCCKGQAVTAPTEIKVGLFSDSGELADPGYSRPLITFKEPVNAESGTAKVIKSNDAGLITATQAWPDISGMQTFDQDDTQVFALTLGAEHQISGLLANDKVELPADKIQFSLD